MIRLNFKQALNNETITFSQKELQRYLLKMTKNITQQITINVTISISDNTSSSVKDGYTIQASPTYIQIQANNNRSTLLGVYRLLFELGCRFLMPGEEHEYIPQITLDNMHINLTETADFFHRGVCIEGADSLENIINFIDWLPKIGCNSFFLQHLEPESFLQNWYTHKYNPEIPSTPLSMSDKERIYAQIDNAIAVRGILYHKGGHGWTSQAVGFSHTCIQSSEPPTPQVQKMLALVQGHRTYWNGVPSNTNLCYAEPSAQKAFVDSVVKYASTHPEVDFLHVWLADEYNNICECSACCSTTLSDQYINILNILDQRLSEAQLSTHIVLLLYQELLWPPIQEKLHNPHRFSLMFAPISRTFSHSYAQRGKTATIPVYERNKIKLPSSIEENLSFLEKWQQFCSLDSFVYDYPLGRAHYGDLGYRHIANIIWQDVRELHNLGLDGYISCQELRAFFPNGFPEYVLGRTLWNSTLSFESLEQEYYSSLYGEHWQTVRDYLKNLSLYSSCDYFNGIGPRYDKALAVQFDNGINYIEKNYTLVQQTIPQNTTLHKQAKKILDYHSRYSLLLLKALYALASGDTINLKEQWQSFMDYIRKEELSFQPYLDVYRVLEVATKYTGFTLDMPR